MDGGLDGDESDDGDYVHPQVGESDDEDSTSHKGDSGDDKLADYEGDSDDIESDEGYKSYGLAEL